MNTIFFSIGSNIGNRRENINQAIMLLESKVGYIQKVSSFYETQPWGLETQNDFYNIVLKLSTKLDIEEVFVKIMDIEKKMKRESRKKWESRIIDIDVLFFNNDIINKVGIQVPHPWLHLRKFVLAPLAEIDADFVHPVLNKSVLEILNTCPDKLDVKIIE